MFLNKETAPFIARVKRPNPLSDVQMGKPGTIEMALSLQAWMERRS